MKVRLVDSLEFWNRYAKKYAEHVKRRKKFFEQRVEKLSKILNLGRETTVLEIGSGPGTYTIPMAKRVKFVTAVEPSIAMVNELLAYAREEGVENIRVVNKRWEEVEVGIDVEPHDIAFAAHSLLVENLEKALKKMLDLAKRAICIITFARRSRWMELYMSIVRELTGATHCPKRRHDYVEVLKVLKDLGYEPSVEIENVEFIEMYGSIDDVVNEWIDRIRARVDGELDLEYVKKRIRDVISEIVVSTNEGIKVKYDYVDAIVWCFKTAEKS